MRRRTAVPCHRHMLSIAVAAPSRPYSAFVAYGDRIGHASNARRKLIFEGMTHELDMLVTPDAS